MTNEEVFENLARGFQLVGLVGLVAEESIFLSNGRVIHTNSLDLTLSPGATTSLGKTFERMKSNAEGEKR